MTKGICSLSQSIAIQCNTLLLLWKTWNYNPSDKKNLCNLCNSVNTISAVYLWILISFEENSTASTKISIFNFLKELWRSNSVMLRNIFIALLFFFSSMQYYYELGKVHVSLFTRYEPPFRYTRISPAPMGKSTGRIIFWPQKYVWGITIMGIFSVIRYM